MADLFTVLSRYDSKTSANTKQYLATVLRNIATNPNEPKYSSIEFISTLEIAWGVQEFYELLNELGFKVLCQSLAEPPFGTGGGGREGSNMHIFA